MKRILPALFLVVLCGCGPGYDYSPYIGQQQNWTTQPGSNVKVVDHISFYEPGHFPNRPYVVMGSAKADNEGALAKAVKREGADAALIYSDRTYRTGTVAVASPGVIWGVPLTSQVIQAQLIRFK